VTEITYHCAPYVYAPGDGDADIFVGADGTVRFIHDDEMTKAMASAGHMSIQRASHVEPVTVPPGGQIYIGRREGGLLYLSSPTREIVAWGADMAPVGGPVLGPFGSRELALEEERLWLLRNNLPACRECGDKET
jgi:hypothetical protein